MKRTRRCLKTGQFCRV